MCPGSGDGGGPNPSCGNPISIATGAKVQAEKEFSVAHISDLSITRFYDSNPFKPGSADVNQFGRRWTHNFESRIQPEAALTLNQSRSDCYISADYQAYWCENKPATTTATVPEAVSVTRPRGNKVFFNRNGLVWQGDSNADFKLLAQYNADNTTVTGWTLRNTSIDEVEQYDAKGRLISITKRNGVVYKLTYSSGATNDTTVSRLPADAPVCGTANAGPTLKAGKLLCVTDNWNKQIKFSYDAKGRINNITDPAGGQYQYAYDGVTGGCGSNTQSISCNASNLTSVTYPDGKTRSYVYNEASNINGGNACDYASSVGNGSGGLPYVLTGIIDENGKRYASWTYDCMGRATSSQHAGGVEKVTLSFVAANASGVQSTVVDTYLGTSANPQKVTATYQFKAMLNTLGNTGVDQPCVNCANISNKTYDANGNIASTTDFNGTITTYEYDLSRNLETKRVDASGTAVAQTTTTSWHANFTSPLQINVPLLRTTYTYDSKGNVLTRTEQTTSDVNGSQGANATVTGSPRTWSYTYNEVGQVLTVTGPRTDVVDKTTYVYDTKGNLSTITNAAGHITTLDNYDANGRVGQITDPNGLVTTLTYTPRGWLKQKVSTGDGQSETTTYDYDNAGQMIKVTLPDNSSISYTYDDAHRLTKVSDNLGNSITYTLDNMGNRINETTTDSSGNLTRQIDRIYDALNRLQKVTGGVQ
ncbi:hypothetical protein UNDKW_4454 [Undibacterium sp. KW1]|uniref:DUF6531 domain-containing protein n=1 Tax=Undibacterium sp. KW1 TaxID=2058624 RepID=UPI001331F523|nr:DUF6531 domain-containing protein [Undibacterium sp. KW1]BBB62727.1 hypothetical protein UNDKW_4454 [Undibacterium sp. KW1]